ncbi:MAG: chorismate-binding protein, partial [Flavobacteriales bacterium]
SASKGSVQVKELCEIYSFETVHQMISTVVAEKKAGMSNGQVIKNLFPMGSMTGAPKVRAMQLIDQYESTCRGIYSGAVGYVDPKGDFDFNVVIRSLMYNEQKKYLSALVGGAITAASVPENEYEECLLKAEALFQSLKS